MAVREGVAADIAGFGLARPAEGAALELRVVERQVVLLAAQHREALSVGQTAISTRLGSPMNADRHCRKSAFTSRIGFTAPRSTVASTSVFRKPSQR